MAPQPLTGVAASPDTVGRYRKNGQIVITFREAIRQKDFVVTVELPLQAATTASDVRQHIDVLAPVVDAAQVGEDESATGHMSSLAAASIVRDGGVDAILRISCRDRNRIALQSDILGAAALGIDSLILVRGEKLLDTGAIRAKGVFEIGSTRLLQLASRLGSESGLIPEPGLFLGSRVMAFKPAEDWSAQLIQQKLDAGASFLQTQPCLNADVLRAYMDKLIERRILRRASAVITVPLLLCAQDARQVREIHKGAPIPDALVERIEQSNDPVAEGVAVCAAFVRELRDLPGVSGVNIQYRGDPGNVVATLEQAKS